MARRCAAAEAVFLQVGHLGSHIVPALQTSSTSRSRTTDRNPSVRIFLV